MEASAWTPGWPGTEAATERDHISSCRRLLSAEAAATSGVSTVSKRWARISAYRRRSWRSGGWSAGGRRSRRCETVPLALTSFTMKVRWSS
ncbi:MAG TPA: hypothetical protein VGC07_08730 [Granulicella sp.]